MRDKRETLTVIIVLLLIGIIGVLGMLGSKYIGQTEESAETTASTTEPVTVTTTEATTETTTETTKETTTETTTETTGYVPSPHLPESATTEDGYISPAWFKQMGRIYGNGYWFTWYSEKVLPGRGLTIPGRHSDGYYVRDEDEYIVLASPDLEKIPKGTVMETPLGWGKVYDHNPKDYSIDVYTSF